MPDAELEISRLRAEVAALRASQAEQERLRSQLTLAQEMTAKARLTLGVAERTETIWLQARREIGEADFSLRAALAGAATP